MSSAIGKKSLALAVAGVLGSMAVSASAAPYLTVSLLGRVQGSGAPFTNSVSVSSTSDVIEYQVHIQLAPEGTSNPFAGAATTQTITDWIPSNAASIPTAGIQQFKFGLTQESTPGTIQVNFTGQAAGQTTGGGTWGAGIGSNFGTLSPRGNGNNDLTGVALLREAGNFDGIGAGDVPEDLDIAHGTMQVTATGNNSQVVPSTAGVLSGTMAFYRWLNATGGTVNFQQTLAQQNTAAANSSPIIVYQPLNLVPEPASLGLLGVGALGLIARRRRA